MSFIKYIFIAFVLVNNFKECLISCQINVGYSHAINDCFHLCFGISSCIDDCEQGYRRRPQFTHRYHSDIDRHSIHNYGSDDENNEQNNEQTVQKSSDGEQPSEESNDEDPISTLSIRFPRLAQPNHCGLRYRQDRGPPNRMGMSGVGANGMGRIVGGEDAEPNEFPWLVSLQITKEGLPNKHFCGATIINLHYLLTAAHCTENILGMERQVIIKAGINNPDEDGQLVRPEKFIVHEEWDQEKQINDISLIRLRTPLRYVTNNLGQYIVNAICLPVDSTDPKGLAQLAGWGQLDEDDNYNADWLQKISLPIWDRKRCNQNYIKYMKILRTHICAGGRGGEDSCMGDSGGPLMKTRGARTYQIGLVSFGIPCAVKGLPGVYTFIAYYMDWIHNNMI